MLLDVGENTVGQIYNLYGEKAKGVIRRVRSIVVSHAHADHCNGIGNFMEEWSRYTEGEGVKIVVVAPRAVLRWIKKCDDKMWKGRMPYVAVDARDVATGGKGGVRKLLNCSGKAG